MARKLQSAGFYYINYIWFIVKFDEHAVDSFFSTAVGILLWVLL